MAGQTVDMDTRRSPDAPDRSLYRLGAAPHRLLFFIGASNLLLAMLWWAGWLAAQRFGWVAMPQPSLPAGWLHAYVMQYQMLPSFVFGFLLTVFPKWLGLPEVPRWRYAPVGLGLFGGQLATLLGALGWEVGLLVGWLMTTAGWIAGLTTLAPLLWRQRGTTWHARSCFAALVLGFIGLLCQGASLLGASPLWLFASIKIGSFGLLLPVYVTVAHRMFPFFAGAVVPGYTPWRPLWLLAAFWALIVAHLMLELVHAYPWLWATDLPLLALTATMCWRWWPKHMEVRVPQAQEAQARPKHMEVRVPQAQEAQARPKHMEVPVPQAQEAQARAKDSALPQAHDGQARQHTHRPALLTVLFIGLAWLPVAFALYSAQSVAYFLTGVFWLGRAPAHALFIGFFGSVLIAMVTRVTQGHAGQALVLPRVAWFAFIAIQVVTVMRIIAELAADPLLWQVLAAVGWLVALAPWVARIGGIYLSPRVDGKAG